MKILAIGNSFSTDATTHLQRLAKSAKMDVYVRNLFIGGCTLRKHHENLLSNDMVYEYEEDGVSLGKIGLLTALGRENWDYVSLQQASHESGLIDTYEPYLGVLVGKIKEVAPESTIMFHRTWAYENDSDHPGFSNYGYLQDQMYQRIVEATDIVALRYDLKLIPVGDMIQKIREIPAFQYGKGGISLCRDGYHLSETYGRYIAAITWLITFCGIPRQMPEYRPPGTDLKLVKAIYDTITNELANR